MRLIAVTKFSFKKNAMKTRSFFAVILLGSIMLSSFRNAPKPKLYPELQKFYDSLANQPRNQSDEVSLKNLISYILQAKVSDKKSAIVFTSTDNSFVSVSAQIVLQSLLSLNKIEKLSVYSCGDAQRNISPLLLSVLSKHGYQVSDGGNNSSSAKNDTIQFGTNINSLTVYSKQASDPSLPKSNFLLIKLCEPESNCADIPGFVYKDHLSFKAPDENISEDEANKLFISIATEITYAFYVANHS